MKNFIGFKSLIFFSIISAVIITAPKCYNDSVDESYNNIDIDAAVSCTATKLRAIPTDPKAEGPWPVGSKSITISGLSAEVWYPATPGSQAGKTHDSYCMKDYIPGMSGTVQEHTWYMNSYRDLPLDTAYGKYPVIVLVHGTGSFKYAAHVYCAHWASRGFVVVSADNPKIFITDVLASAANILLADQKGDTRKLLAALRAPSGSLAFLKGYIDTTRFGLTGHSAGGAAVTGLNNETGVRVIMPMAGPGIIYKGLNLESVLYLAGIKDNTAPWSLNQTNYALSTVTKKRLVGIPDAGHMVFTNVCESVAKSGNYGVDLSSLETVANDGCGSGYINQELGWEIVNYASTAVFEEVLQCNKTSVSSINAITGKYSGVVYKKTY